jgi:hypothetical protein
MSRKAQAYAVPGDNGDGPNRIASGSAGVDRNDLTTFNGQALFSDPFGKESIILQSWKADVPRLRPRGSMETPAVAVTESQSASAVLNSALIFNSADAEDVGLRPIEAPPARWTAIMTGNATEFSSPALTPTTSGSGDILFQNTDGEAMILEVNGVNVIDANNAGTNPGGSWVAVGTGDFDGDGLFDILWQNIDGQIAIWEMDGSNVVGGGTVANPGPSWKAIGTGDFNDDGKSDILFQNMSSGQVAIWDMNGINVIDEAFANSSPTAGWVAVGAGDFNDDGRSDILWQNSNGQAAISMNGAAGGELVGPNPGASWKAVATGDFNHDGSSDILWQNTNGQVAIWEMNGTDVVGGGMLDTNPGPTWQAIGTGGEESSDILFQNTNGQTAIWEISGTNLIGGGIVDANLGQSWRAVGLS